MLNGIDINVAKQYNATVKAYRDKANQLQTEIKINKEQLQNACKELSVELGIEVNESNLREVLEQQEAKIQTTINTGTAVINKIKAEQSGNVNASTMTGNTVGTMTGMGQNTPVTNNVNPGMATGTSQQGQVNNMFAGQDMSVFGQAQTSQVNLQSFAGGQQPFFQI